jgi:uncharacterized membrane protein
MDTDNTAISNAPAQNVGDTERQASMIAGGVVAAFGLYRLMKKGWVDGPALLATGGGLIARGTTGRCIAYQALGVNTAQSPEEKDAKKPGEDGIHVHEVVTVDKSPAEVYAFWRDFENLPHFMKHLESVTVQDATRSHWAAKAPMGKTVAWDAQIINDVPNTVIAWQSLPGADIPNAGSVRFEPASGNRGTEVRVTLQYNPPAHQVGAMVAKLFGEEPSMQVSEDLRRLKALLETGEVPSVAGQPEGPRSMKGRMLTQLEK